jgi:drug/metabolite transporter (DMT)-like permease
MVNRITRLVIVAAPLLFVVMWATGFVVSRLSAPHVDPLTFLTIRFPIAGLIFAAIAVSVKAPWPKGRLAVHAMVAGVLLHAAYLGPIYWAVARGMPAGVSALIIGLQPLITAVMAAQILGERITIRHWLALVVGVAGVGLVISPKLSFTVLGGITPVTTLACVGGAIAISLGTVYQKRFATGLHLASGGAWQYVGATLAAGAVALLFEDLRFDGTFNAWFALGWSVIVLSLGAITLLMMLIREGQVGRVASLIFLVPGVAALMTFALFDETLTPLQLLGMAVCAAAVLIVSRSPARPT